MEIDPDHLQWGVLLGDGLHKRRRRDVAELGPVRSNELDYDVGATTALDCDVEPAICVPPALLREPLRKMVRLVRYPVDDDSNFAKFGGARMLLRETD